MPCNNDYCISNTNTLFDDTYTITGTYNGYDYWSGITNNNFIFYSNTENSWCVSTSLGGSCTFFGKTPCISSCPDLCNSIFSENPCPTPLPTLPPCDIVFDSVFDCLPTPSVTPSPTPSSTPILPPPPPPVDLCSGLSVNYSAITYTPTPTPTPSSTPVVTTTPITYNCSYNGQVIFNTINDYIICPSSKKFKDCTNGAFYYINGIVLSPSNDIPIVGNVYKANINNVEICVVFMGLADNISGVDSITLLVDYGPENNDGCLNCNI